MVVISWGGLAAVADFFCIEIRSEKRRLPGFLLDNAADDRLFCRVMLKKLLVLALVLAFSPHSGAVEKRVFHNADKTKSFSGVPIGYDTKTGVVTVRKTAGQTIHFKLELLCKEDREYIKENAMVLAAANGIRIDFDLFKGKVETSKKGKERTTIYPAGYEITIENRTDADIPAVELQYIIFHRKGAENGAGSIAQTTGTFTFDPLFAKYPRSEKTEPVQLIRYMRQATGSC